MMWTDTDDAHPGRRARTRVRTDAGNALRLVYRARVIAAIEERRSLVLGLRDGTADLVVPDRMALARPLRDRAAPGQVRVSPIAAPTAPTSSIDGDRRSCCAARRRRCARHGFITLGQSRATATEFVEYFCE